MTAKTRTNQKRVEILVVEDSPTQAEGLRFLLDQHGYRVLVARNGRQALAHLSKHKSALVISDISMPEMNGYELCRQIKTYENIHDIPVILLTSLSNPEDVLEGLACGADNFITKPFHADYLLAHVQQVLANRELDQNENVRMGMEVVVAGKKHFVSAASQQILGLLLSTYEAAVQRNNELIQAQEELHSLNENLEEKTRELAVEIIESKRLQDELSELSLHDELTGLLNRRGFMTLAEQHTRIADRNKQKFTILYIDLDGLKQIKSSLGHAAGDQALRTVARAMERSFRASDILAHIGADEFSVLFADCDRVGARVAIARLNNNLSLEKAAGTGLLPLSLTIGLAQFNPDDKIGIIDLLEQADADMYAHKQHLNERRD